MSLPTAPTAQQVINKQNKPSNTRRNNNNRQPRKKGPSSEMHDKVQKSLQNGEEDTMSTAIAADLKLQNISTAHICEGLPAEVSFLHECEICFESREFFGMLPCNHSACIQCLIKQTMFSEKISCCQCRNEYTGLVFFRVTSTFPEQYPPVDVERCRRRYMSRYNTKLQRKYNIVFGCSLSVQAYDHVLGHRCHICDRADEDSDHKNFERLKEHYWNKHRRKFCDLCCEHEKKFSCERIPFTIEELKLHLAGKKTGWGDLATSGHSLCMFCKNKHFYSVDERFRHYRVDHQTCEICLKEKNEFMVFENFNILLSHYSDRHFLCTDQMCRNAGICYSTDQELQLHVADVHKSSGARTQAVPLSFPSTLRHVRQPAPSSSTTHTNNENVNRQRQNGAFNSISNGVIVGSAASNGLNGRINNYVHNRPIGLNADAFPALITAPIPAPRPFVRQGGNISSVLINKPMSSSIPPTSGFNNTADNFPILPSRPNNGVKGNSWGSGNTQKLKQSLVKSAITSVNSNKAKEVPKPRPFDPNSWSAANGGGNSKPIPVIPRIAGFQDFEEVTSKKGAKPQIIQPPQSEEVAEETTEPAEVKPFPGYERQRIPTARLDGFSVAGTSKKPSFGSLNKPVKTVRPEESFPVLRNPYEVKKNTISATITNTGALNIGQTEAQPFDSVICNLFKNLAQKRKEENGE
uniref:RING-type domain-containing protein n=1 Tax=Rhabditophanes sp. KR3021 TaxID=114890 RepID=A0AC35U9Q0_9BILA